MIDTILSLGWKIEKLRIANQVRLQLKTYFLLDLLLLGTNKIKWLLRLGLIDDTISSEHPWPIVQPNNNSLSTWKQDIANIINNDGTLYQSIR